MKILIATDGSVYSEAAIKAVAARPWPANSEMRVITVMEHTPIAGISGGEFGLQFTDYLSQVRNYLKELAIQASGQLRQDSYNVSYTVREGAPAEEILEEAKSWEADLIVMGTHGRRGLSRFLLGSVAERIAAHAPCSVEIVRTPKVESEK
jgi:nucleotide-binding universal stress UspA family protein